MRHWFKKIPRAENPASPWQAEKAAEILKKPEYAHAVLQIKSLISVSAAQFEACYLPPLLALAGAAQVLPAYEAGIYQRAGGLLAKVLQRTIYALKKRQGLLLPPGSAVEEQYREQDIWTYALYTASLLQDCDVLATGFMLFDADENRIAIPWQLPAPGIGYRFQPCELPDLEERRSLRLLIAGRWLPTTSLQWLSRFPQVLADWLKTLTEQSSSAVIADILAKSHDSLKGRAVSTMLPCPIELSPITEQVTLQPTDIIKAPIASQTAANAFLDWLRDTLASPDYPINTLEGGIFHLDEGCLIVYPTLLETFLNTHNNRFSVDELRQQLQPLAITEVQGLQRYCVGDWQNRTLVEGLLLKKDAVFPAEVLPPIYDHAYRDG